MQTTNFRVAVVEESDVVEICGALKVILLKANTLPPKDSVYCVWLRPYKLTHSTLNSLNIEQH